jgi:hypothetical protein
MVVSGGALAWCVFVVGVYVRSDLDVTKASATDRLVWWSGRTLIWVGGCLVAGSLVGVVAFAVFRILVGGL